MATASEKLRNDMQRALSNVHAELERIEILAAALDALSGPLGISEVFKYMWCTDRRTILNRRVWQTYR